MVDGSFEGRFAPDLRSLAAIWTTVGSGDVGALTLRVDSTAQTFKSRGPKTDDPPL